MAYSFDGVNDSISFGANANIGGFTAMSVCVWLDPGAALGQENLVSKASAGAQWQLRINSGANARFQRDFSGVDGVWTGVGIFATNTLVHLAMTYDGASTANDPVFYKDGAVVTTNEPTTPVGSVNTDAASALRIGTDSGNADDFTGIMGFLVYYNGILDAAQVNRCRWWGTPGGAVAVYQPLLTDLNNRGTGTANGTASGATQNNAALPRVERNWGCLMGVGR